MKLLYIAFADNTITGETNSETQNTCAESSRTVAAVWGKG